MMHVKAVKIINRLMHEYEALHEMKEFVEYMSNTAEEEARLKASIRELQAELERMTGEANGVMVDAQQQAEAVKRNALVEAAAAYEEACVIRQDADAYIEKMRMETREAIDEYAREAEKLAAVRSELQAQTMTLESLHAQIEEARTYLRKLAMRAEEHGQN